MSNPSVIYCSLLYINVVQQARPPSSMMCTKATNVSCSLSFPPSTLISLRDTRFMCSAYQTQIQCCSASYALLLLSYPMQYYFTGTYIRQYHNLRPYIAVSAIPNFDPTQVSGEGEIVCIQIFIYIYIHI